jgi:hypothetical protein
MSKKYHSFKTIIKVTCVKKLLMHPQMHHFKTISVQHICELHHHQALKLPIIEKMFTNVLLKVIKCLISFCLNL